MDDLERRQTEMILRVNNFGAENAAAIAGNAVAVQAFGKVSDFVAQLEDKGEKRSSATQTKFSKSAHRKMNRNELNADLAAISRTAAAIEENNPGFDNVFRVPRKNLNDAVLIETARAFHTNASAAAAKNLFTGYGLPADFLDDLQADTDAFEAAISQQDSANRERVGANADIDDILDEALKAVGTLKVVVPNIFRGDAGKLADWTAASHVEKAPKKTKAEPNPPPA
ncbi:MAG TPA: hypothetical protein VK400_08120 [Pyrinomonadaceae bacterium]|nr:hypothetical protein [Pyrinomonadaceae bacterium]